MPEQVVSMEKVEWQQLLAILCNAQGPGISWATCNPLVMKIGNQLQQQEPGAEIAYAKTPGNGLDPDPDMQELNPRRVPRPQ